MLKPSARTRSALAAVLSVTLCGLGGDLRISAANSETTEQPVEARLVEAELRKFLPSTQGTYGWSPVKGTISYDFFPDGRVHIQGPDGEATMWQGKWSLVGDQITIINSDKKQKKTVRAAVAGEDLRLDGVLYRRYRPE